ncbi:hypothetical protein DEJ50_04100 [Streptomyces venezuelae]|uniref:Beta-lactamase-related domain-containing protein n=1 Tax=Streptomyces venezuelae TaxID=54571 RepID=A0A5P2CW65_STRVZ|nr:hypothetical protein DEJ50_04100 [Streptomyces venezuelae]
MPWSRWYWPVSPSRRHTPPATTATDAVLLLAGRHQLALSDPLSGFLDNPPSWTRDVTLGDLMRHTSGIPGGGRCRQGRVVRREGRLLHSQFLPLEAVRRRVRPRHPRRIRPLGRQLPNRSRRWHVSVDDVLRRRGVDDGRYGAGIPSRPGVSAWERAGELAAAHSTGKGSISMPAAADFSGCPGKNSYPGTRWGNSPHKNLSSMLLSIQLQFWYPKSASRFRFFRQGIIAATRHPYSADVGVLPQRRRIWLLVP